MLSNRKRIRVFAAALMVTWPSLLISRPDTIPMPGTVLVPENEDAVVVKVALEDIPSCSLAIIRGLLADIQASYKQASTVAQVSAGDKDRNTCLEVELKCLKEGRKCIKHASTLQHCTIIITQLSECCQAQHTSILLNPCTTFLPYYPTSKSSLCLRDSWFSHHYTPSPRQGISRNQFKHFSGTGLSTMLIQCCVEVGLEGQPKPQPQHGTVR